MGQIHRPSLGSPACQVTSAGELLVSLSSGGDTKRVNELILSPGSKYAWCMTTTSSDDLIINADGFWFEH